MGVSPYGIPPPLSDALSWRVLWRAGAFTQLDLLWDTSFSGDAKDRGLFLGIGQRPLEALDVQGALQPIAFAAGGNPHGFIDLAPFEARMTFREEEPAREWSAHAWNAHVRPHTSALYSPWQLLYVDDVLDAPTARLGLETLRASAEQCDAALKQWRELLGAWTPPIDKMLSMWMWRASAPSRVKGEPGSGRRCLVRGGL